MKKLICLCLTSLALVCCLSACAGNEKSTIDDDVKVINLETTRQQETTTQKIRKNKTYKIAMTEELIATEFEGNVASYAATYNYEIVENENGKIVFKMDGNQYKMLLSRVGSNTIRQIGELVDSDDFSFTVKIGDYASDFSYLLILVNTKKYNKSEKKDIFPELLGQCGLYYQTYSNPDAPSCQVVIADSKSGEVLFNETYTQ